MNNHRQLLSMANLNYFWLLNNWEEICLMTTIPQVNFTNIPHIVFQVFNVHSYLVTFVNFGFSLNFSEEQDEVITSFYFFMLSIQNYYSVLYFTALYVLWMKEYTQGFQDIVK